MKAKRDIFRSMKEEANSRLDKALANVPLPSLEGANLALYLSEIARSNLTSSGDDYNSKRYADAADALQQGVEKTSKALGLLMGTTKPTDDEMRKVRHDSYKAFLLHFGEFYPRLVALMKAEAEIPDSSLFDTPGMGGARNFLRKRFQNQLDNTPPIAKVQAEIAELMTLKDDEMWKATISMDTNNKWVATSVEQLKNRAVFSRTQKALIGAGHGAISPFRLFKKETLERTNLAKELGEASEGIFWLAILTCWHFEQSRYPSIGRYWDQKAYNESAPYIRALPELTKKAEACAKHTIEASKSALKIVKPS